MIRKSTSTHLKIATVQGSLGTNEAVEAHGAGTYQNAPFTLDVSGAMIRMRQRNVNLKDESTDLRFYDYPNEATLFSARSPIHIGGTFKKPSAGLDAEALTLRGGAAALLAFIDPGLGTKRDCFFFIKGMDAHMVAAKTLPARLSTPPNLGLSPVPGQIKDKIVWIFDVYT